MKKSEMLKISARLGWKNIWRQKKRSIIILSSAAVGMLGILFTMGFMNGFLQTMMGAAIDSGLGHVQVRPAGYMKTKKLSLSIHNPEKLLKKLKNSGLKNWSPRFEREGALRLDTRFRGVNVVGIDSESEKRVSTFHRWITDGRFLESDEPKSILVSALIGKVNAEKFEVETGDSLVLSIGNQKGNAASVRIKIVGIFQSASEALDKTIVIVHRKTLSRLYSGHKNMMGYISFKAKDRKNAESLFQQVKEIFRPVSEVEVLSYKSLEPTLSRMLEMSEKYMFIFYLVLMLGFGLTLFDTVTMSVLEKTYEIGLLRAIGSPGIMVFSMILFESLFLTALGSSLGIGIGFGVVKILENSGISLEFFSKGLELMARSGNYIFPFLTLSNLLTALGLGVFVSLFAGVFPAIKGVRMIPVHALREKA